MRKRGFQFAILSVFFLVLAVNLTSAFYYGGSFSLSDFLDSLDPSLVVLGSVFIIVFAIANFSLSKLFREQKAIAGIVAFVVAFMTVYGINKSGFDYESLFFDLGLTTDIIYVVAPIILLGGAVYIIWKAESFRTGLGNLFLILGIFIVGAGFLSMRGVADIVYEGGAAFIIGIVLILAGAWLLKKKNSLGSSYDSYDYGYYGYPKKSLFKRTRNAISWGKDRIDPRSRLARYELKRQIKREKEIARERLKYRDIKKAQEEAIRENRAYDIQRYKKIIKRLNSMPGGKYIKKGTPGYKEYISLYREAENLRRKLGVR